MITSIYQEDIKMSSSNGIPTSIDLYALIFETPRSLKQDSRESMFFILFLVWPNQSKLNCITFRLSPACVLYNGKKIEMSTDAMYSWIILSTIIEVDRYHGTLLKNTGLLKIEGKNISSLLILMYLFSKGTFI